MKPVRTTTANGATIITAPICVRKSMWQLCLINKWNWMINGEVKKVVRASSRSQQTAVDAAIRWMEIIHLIKRPSAVEVMGLVAQLVVSVLSPKHSEIINYNNDNLNKDSTPSKKLIKKRLKRWVCEKGVTTGYKDLLTWFKRKGKRRCKLVTYVSIDTTHMDWLLYDSVSTTTLKTSQQQN